MAEPNYSGIIQRILDLLKADTTFAKKISEFRFGELPEQTNANSFPACYVTPSSNPEISRESIGSARSLGRLPGQKITSEFWIVLVSSPQATPADAQKQVYELKGDIITILGKNTQLRKSDDTEPQCSSLTIHAQPRLTKQRGKIVDAITVVIRTVNYVKSPE